MAPHGDLPPNQQKADFLDALRDVLSPEALAAIEAWATQTVVDGDREALGLPRRLSALEEAEEKAHTRIGALENTVPNNSYRRKVKDGHHHEMPVEGMDDQVSQGFGYQLDAINGIKLTRGSWPFNLRLTIDGTGGIGPFEFDHIVDADFAAVVSAGDGTEGMQLTTLHGHTFKVWSTVQAAIDDWVSTGGPKSILVVPGNYSAENISCETHLIDSGTHSLVITSVPGVLTSIGNLTVVGKYGNVSPNFPISRIENLRIVGDLILGSDNDRDLAGMGFINLRVDGDILFKSDTIVGTADYLTFDHVVFGGGVDDNNIVITLSRTRFHFCTWETRFNLFKKSGSSRSTLSSVIFSDCQLPDGIQIGQLESFVQFDDTIIGGDTTSNGAFQLGSTSGAAPPKYARVSFTGCDFSYQDHSAEWAYILIGVAGANAADYINLSITGCTFEVPFLAADSEAPIHILWAPDDGSVSGTIVHAALVGNSFIEDSDGNRMEDLATTSTSYSVKGYFERSVFGPNVPADFEVELLGGTKNLYVGTGTVVGTGIISVSNALWDADEDTGIQVEESPDEDIIRFDAAGSEIAAIDASGLTMRDNIIRDLANPVLGGDAVNLNTLLDSMTISLHYHFLAANVMSSVFSAGEAFEDELITGTPQELTTIFQVSTAADTPTPATVGAGSLISVHFDAEVLAVSGKKPVFVYVQLGYVDADGSSNFVQIGSDSDPTTVALTTDKEEVELHIHVDAETNIPAGKRLKVKWWATTTGALPDPTVHIYYGALNDHITIPISASILGNYLPLAGGTMTGDINLDGNNIPEVNSFILAMS